MVMVVVVVMVFMLVMAFILLVQVGDDAEIAADKVCHFPDKLAGQLLGRYRKPVCHNVFASVSSNESRDEGCQFGSAAPSRDVRK